ncbi:MAG: hypothetical protein OXU61_08600 [Gammaproteobacteria bacterium]|nr:hypothetical protein [Gammaproteobacteria bacterium]
MASASSNLWALSEAMDDMKTYSMKKIDSNPDTSVTMLHALITHK